MMVSTRSMAVLAATAASLALAACSSGPKVAPAAAPPVAIAPGEVEAIAELLDRGEVAGARARLDAALSQDPMSPQLLVLRQGMVGDAKADLGSTSYPYTVIAGDTMAGLAERLLGNRLKSYQLARYNGIANPATLAPGQVLRIPGQQAGARSDRSGDGSATPRRDRPAAAPAVQASPRSPAARGPDIASAQRARTAGLAALNKGDVADAVVLLERAAVLDPGNTTIKNDLARARRISATVRSRR